MRTSRRLAKLGALLATVGIAGIWLAASASAHVTVAAPGVIAGASDAAITFRVPNESDTTSTVGLKLQLPTHHLPMVGVMVSPQPGWTAIIAQIKLVPPIETDDGQITQVVSEINWKADRTSGIKPGYVGEFSIIAGKLPDEVSSFTFKAIQTYSDGKQVSWIEEAAPGSTTEPDHPAPKLQLALAATESSPSVSASAAGVAVTVGSSDKGASKGAATTGIALGTIGVLLGAAALMVTLRRGGRRAAVE